MRAALAVATLALLCGCASRIRDGEVYGKGFKPASTIVMLMPITTCRAVSKVTSCSTMFFPFFVHYPDRWYVDIKKFDGKEWRTARWWIPQSGYDQIVVGGYFEVTNDCLGDEPRRRGKRATDQGSDAR